MVAAAPVDPVTKVISTVTGVLSGLLSLVGLGPSAGSPSSPAAQPPLLSAVLEFVRRELFNSSPTVDPSPPATSLSTGQITGHLGATDADDDALVYKVTQDPSHGTVTVDAAGGYTYTPDAAYVGTDTFTIRASDDTYPHLHLLFGIFKPNFGHTDAATIGVTVVDHAPKAVGEGYTTDEDTTLTVPAATGLLANDTDIDHNTLTASKVTDPGHGTVIVNGDGSFTYTPTTVNYHGPDSFTYKTFDGTLDSSPATVHITVAAVNDPPVAMDDTITTGENTAVAGNVLFNDTDVDNPHTDLTAHVLTGPSHAASFSLNADGTYAYTPVTGYRGPDLFTYNAFDGTATSNVATAHITVAPINHPPTAVGDSFSIPESTALTNNVLNNDTDPDTPHSALSATLVKGPEHAANFVLNNDGTFTYTPVTGYKGSDLFKYTAFDGSSASATATAAISVGVVDDGPTAFDDTYTTIENGGLIRNVLVNDANLQTDVVDLGAQLVSGPGHAASFVLNTNGSFTYTPVTGYHGPDTFTYKATDGDTINSNTATVTITIIDTDAIAAAPVIHEVDTAIVGKSDTYTVSVDATSPNGQPLFYDMTNTNVTSGGFSRSEDGTYSWTPTSPYSPSVITAFTFDGSTIGNPAASPVFVAFPVDTTRHDGVIRVHILSSTLAPPMSVSDQNGTVLTPTAQYTLDDRIVDSYFDLPPGQTLANDSLIVTFNDQKVITTTTITDPNFTLFLE
jgi:VCBS repeat-containing protein